MSEAEKLSFSLNSRITLLTALLLPLLLLLGNWQLQRAAEKREIASQLAQRQQMAPLRIDELDAEADDLAFRRVALKGEFDQARQFLLDNRQQQGRVGYELLTPFRDIGGQWLLVNRGWLAAGPSRQELPPLPSAPAGELSIVAQVYVPPGAPILLEEQHFEPNWPVVIQAVEMDKLAGVLERDLFPFELRIEAGEPAALVVNWPAINMRPEQHIGYAVQWFAAAAALLLWFVFANTNLWQKFRARSAPPPGDQ